MKKKKYSKIHENLKADISSGQFLANIVLVTLVTNATFKLIEHFEDNINPILFEILDLTTILIAFIFAIINFIISIKKNRQKREDLDVIIDNSIIDKVLNSPLNKKYKDSKYEWYHINNNYALSSYKINKDLFVNKEKYLMSYDKNLDELNDRQKKILLKIYNDKRKNNVILFNDPHPGLRTDIYYNENKTYILNVKKTNYFSHITSNQLIYKRFYNPDSTLYYDGWKMTLNDNFSLKDIEKSRAANMFGVSSLLISSDGYLIISRQGKKNDSGVNELIPSATGSIDISDINFKNYQEINKNKYYYLNEMIINAGKREMEEETHVPTKFIKDAYVIGYMRMLFLGGHPEFMCLLSSTLTKDEIVNVFMKGENHIPDTNGLFLDRTGKEIDELKTNIKLEDVYNMDIDTLIKEKLPNESVSIQLYMLLTMIHKHHENGIL